MKGVLFQSRGFTLIETIIAGAILMIIAAGFATVITNAQDNIRKATVRYEKLEHRGIVTSALSDNDVCTCSLSSAVQPFNGGSADGSTSVGPLRFDCEASSPILAGQGALIPNTTTGLAVRAISLKNINVLSPDRYRGKLIVEYEVRGRKDSFASWEIDLKFRTDQASPLGAKKFLACEFLGSAGGARGPATTIAGSCPSGQYMTGISSGSISCSAVAMAGEITNKNPAFSAIRPGPGCVGSGCVTADFGPCDGSGCRTNGSKCSGSGCSACIAGSCIGSGCCTGPSCQGCAVFKSKNL